VSIIFYNSNNTKAGRRLQEILEANVLEKNIETYKNMDALIKRFNHIDPGNINIAVLLIGSLTEIFQARLINHFLNEIHIILVLPERSTSMISSGFKVCPRFIGYIDDDFNDIAMVFRKIQQNVKGKEFRYE
jgi:hypothetical protein